MAKVQIQCAHCGKPALKLAGGVNRSRSVGAPVFCSKACFGLSRRLNKSKDQKVAEKAIYDAEYRERNRSMLKAKKADYFRRTYDPVKAASERKKRMPRHVEYCRQPEYRAWKREYDRRYRAEKEYGEYGECFLLTQDIRAECLRQMTDYEIRVTKGTLNKRQQRKREYERSLREEPQVGPVGNLELGQGWQNGGLASGLRRIAGSRNPSHDEHSVASGAAGEAPGGGGSRYVFGNVSKSPLFRTSDRRGAST